MSKDVNASTNDISTGGKSLETELEKLEKRRRDAQAALTPLQQENIKLKAELAAAKTPVESTITPEKQQELDDMKFTDPDKWKAETNELDKANKTAHDQKVAELTRIETDKVEAQAFMNANPGIDKDVIKQIIPLSIQQKYEDGELTIGQVLEAGKKLLEGAPVASVIAPDSPKIGEVAGSDRPTDQAKEKQTKEDWGTALV